MSVLEILSGFPEDQQRLLITIIISLPLSFILTFIKNVYVRKSINLLTGLLMQIYMYGLPYLNVIISSITILIILNLVSRKKVGYVILIYSFSHLSILHLYRQIYDYGSWKMDITLIFMILSLKFSAFGFSYQDAELYKIKDEAPKHLKEYIIYDFSLIDYFGYVVFFPTALMGPFIEFNDFKNFIELKEDFENIPLTIIPALIRFVFAFLFIVIHLRIKTFTSVNHFLNSEGIEKWIGYCLMLCVKFRYYLAFLLAESICIASGVSYISTKEDKWSRIKNVNILPCETQFNVKNFFQNWNISVHNFLKRYVYFRWSNKDDANSKNLAQLMTFAFSAVWHGFYPSYYFLFAHFALGSIIQEQFQTIKKLYNLKIGARILDIIFIICYFFFGNYCVGVIEALDYQVMFKFMKSLLFLPSIVMVIAYLISNFFIGLKKEKKNN